MAERALSREGSQPVVGDTPADGSAACGSAEVEGCVSEQLQHFESLFRKLVDGELREAAFDWYDEDYYELERSLGRGTCLTCSLRSLVNGPKVCYLVEVCRRSKSSGKEDLLKTPCEVRVTYVS